MDLIIKIFHVMESRFDFSDEYNILLKYAFTKFDFKREYDHYCALYHFRIVNLLKDLSNCDYEIPLFVACKVNDPKLIQFFLDKGADNYDKALDTIKNSRCIKQVLYMILKGGNICMYNLSLRRIDYEYLLKKEFDTSSVARSNYLYSFQIISKNMSDVKNLLSIIMTNAMVNGILAF